MEDDGPGSIPILECDSTDEEFDCMQLLQLQEQSTSHVGLNSTRNPSRSGAEEDSEGILEASAKVEQELGVKLAKPQEFCKVLLCGISFMARCFDNLPMEAGEVTHYDLNLGIPEEEAEVFWWTRRGGYLRGFEYGLNKVLRKTCPKVVLLEIGSNDLCDPEVAPEELAIDVTRVVIRMLASPWVKVVALLPVLHRKKSGVWDVHNGVEQYNDKVDRYNAAVKDWTEERGDAMIWSYNRTIAGPNCSPWERDGVHLRPSKMNAYYNDLRGAMIRAKAMAQGMVSMKRY